jgi:hypothetical protein
MKVTISIILIFALLVPSAFAGLSGDKAAYQGGTTKDKDFSGIKDAIEGNFVTSDDSALKFEYRFKKENRVYSIPYKQFLDIEYGQKAGRRVGASVATAILVSPIGLFMLFSKKRKHYVTIGYTDADAKEQVAVFELGKDLIRTTLPILEARSGKKITYQDEETKKSAK